MVGSSGALRARPAPKAFPSWRLADDQRHGPSRPVNVPCPDRLGSVRLGRCRPRFRRDTAQGGPVHARRISGGSSSYRRRYGRGTNTVETPSDGPLSSRTTPAAGTVVGRAPGGDAARGHALLPRFAGQAVDGSVRTPVNPDRSEQRGLASREVSLRLPSGLFTPQPAAVLTLGPLQPSPACLARPAPS